MYRLEQLAKRFDTGVNALVGIDLAVQKGEQVALIGPSGAGKTTLFRLLNLTLPPTAGRLFFAGADTRALRGRRLREARRRIGTIYQQHNLIPRLPVVHNVLAGRLGTWSAWKALCSLIRPLESERAYEALSRVGIPEKLFVRADQLSGGQQQRVAIARVLVQNPDVILADEPVSSVDPKLARELVQLLTEISSAQGKTLLVNLHNVELALQGFPRVIGVRQGEILFDRPRSQVTQELLEVLYTGEAIAHESTRSLVAHRTHAGDANQFTACAD